MSRSDRWSSRIVEGYRLPEINLVDAFRSALNYKPRDDDIFVATYPKSGTMWVKYIITLIVRQGEPPGKDDTLNDLKGFLEIAGRKLIERMKRPGVITTHLPFHLVPWSASAKYIHVSRNPKDACVSLFYHIKDTVGRGYDGSFDDFFEDYLSGEIDFGGYFDHLMGWYEHRNDRNILFLTYEEMKEKAEATILKIASFLDDVKYAEPLRKDRHKLENVIKYSSFEEMKVPCNKIIDKMLYMSLEHLKNEEFSEGVFEIVSKLQKNHVLKHRGLAGKPKTSNFFRKGIIGDWRHHFSEEQSRRMDEKYAEKTKDTEIANLFKEYM